MYIVTYTDYGDTCDMHSRKLGSYDSKREAESAVQADMEDRKDYYGEEAVIRPNLHEIWACEADIGRVGCVWDILKV